MSAIEKHRIGVLLGCAVFAAALGVAVARVGFFTEAGGVRLSAGWVMTDFYSAAYNPIRALLAGQTPYDIDATYPPYAPSYLLLHLPFGVLSPGVAGILYFLFTALLTVVLAYLALRLIRITPNSARVLGIAGAVLLSRPGHWALLLGQPAILLTVMAYLAFLYAETRPVLGGWALSATLLKPTYGLPLGLLIWAWGRWRAAAIGLGLAALINVPLVALLATREGGLRELINSAASGYRGWQDLPDVNPATSNTRTDAASLISRFLGTPLSSLEQSLLAVAVLLLCVAVLRRLAKHRTHQAATLATSIICLATSVVGFHRGYDLVLLSVPFLAAVVPGSLPPLSQGLRITIIALFSVLALNWGVTESVLASWQPSRPEWLAATSVNGLCLVFLLVFYLALGASYAGGTPAATTIERDFGSGES